MSPTWRPDDSLLREEGGKLLGTKRVSAALKKRGVRGGRRIVTSRDRGLSAVQQDLVRERLPKGIQQWQLPVTLGANQDVLVFLTLGSPNAVLPAHSHQADLFRVVIFGSVIYKGEVLTAGDWMVVPCGQTYELKFGPQGASVMHHYTPCRK